MFKHFDVILFRFFVFWFSCGLVLLTFDILPPILEWANAVFLILTGVLGATFFIRQYGTKIGSLLSFLIVFITFVIEGAGVHYGILFGDYYYNPDFGLIIFEVPFTIGAAWLMVIATTHVIARAYSRRIQNKLFEWFTYALVGSFAAVIMDVILDPVAFQVKEYWVWTAGGFYYDIPLSNFTGWFVLAFILHSAVFFTLHLVNKWHGSISRYWQPRMIYLYVMVISMFLVLAITNGLWLATLASIGLTAIVIGGYFRLKEQAI
ncbi:carotenoid biosynthesis protein [Alkalicoccobacillus porphyridii]|uniref:Carotenoid biosynthesis protein n=1 Tax=Alkalicoccobacillus porphyridii TaxID=2597270 RepID=A0A553ZYR6_9BACI|nr:carotenoid biosynthesis protein [Alkalicoccobacillus porphyridii]TSB46584.1 carotenoid biosynthesis protein [Alkalicoccobacillus porphyridii]